MDKLVLMMPTSDEIEVVKNYDGDSSLLGPIDKLFVVLSDIPRFATLLLLINVLD